MASPHIIVCLFAFIFAVEAIVLDHFHPSIDLGTFCYAPLFNSDVAHLYSCPSEDLSPRYYLPAPAPAPASETSSERDGSGSESEEDERENSPVWDKIGPCMREDPSNATSTEFCVYFSARFGGGRGIVVVTSASRAAYLSTLPAFHTPKSPRDINVFNRKARVASIPGKGYGLVATETITKGEGIISETASMLIDYHPVNALGQMDVMRMQSHGLEYLPAFHREKVLNMSTHGEVLDTVHKLEKVMVTNAFEATLRDKDKNKLYALFADTARMNHDCRPNVGYYFDKKTITHHATALRDIYPGEEITISYTNGLRPRRERQKALMRSWGFKCACSLCSLSPAQTRASDARLAQISSLRDALSDRTLESPATPQMAELLVSLLEQERMHLLLGEAYEHAAREWNGVGEPWAASKYARLAIEEEVARTRDDRGRDVRDMMELAENPWEHSSWMWRTKERMNWKPLKEGTD